MNEEELRDWERRACELLQVSSSGPARLQAVTVLKLIAEVRRLTADNERLRLLNERIAHDEMCIRMGLDDATTEIERLQKQLSRYDTTETYDESWHKQYVK